MLLSSLKKIVEENQVGKNFSLVRNLLKENLQYYVLDFLFSSKWAERLLFKGGTCLRFCFDLPRLSEDLDFDVKNYSASVSQEVAKDIENYFVKKWQFKKIKTKVAGNGHQIFLKFSVLADLGLVKNPKSETDILFLRIDLSPVLSKSYEEELSVKSTYDFNFILRRYSLSDLMASKIVAILRRSFKKGKKVNFKGRDYFDLWWFLDRGVKPNWKMIKELAGIKTRSEVVRQLDKKVGLVKEAYLMEDLRPLFKDQKWLVNFVKNFKKIYESERVKLVKS
ncbi:hypothetical protein DRH14_00505 [Candidatus Shapirobacteria bacterium]|nr:MAG: hypothetical protein DRH14_00505 [Candidatus Shapirobacteria bacterium]